MPNSAEYKGPYGLQKILFWVATALLLIQIINDPMDLWEKIFPPSTDLQKEAGLIRDAGKIRTEQENVLAPGCSDGNCENGEGTWVYLDGSVYKGQFINKKPDGFGLFVFALSGSSPCRFYVGTFALGYPKSGYIEYENGSTYRGEVNAQYKRHGKGMFSDRSSHSGKSGVWEEDTLAM